MGIELPESVTMEILSRLPVKSLKRFTCVCKPWASYFQTSYFITKHHHYHLHNDNLRLLLKRSHVNTHGDYITYFSTLSTAAGKEQNFVVEDNIYLPNFSCDLQVYGPCNGLLCLSDNGHRPTVWNPSTREFKTIPESTIQRPPSVKSKSTHCALGFGFDSATDDYKVIRFVLNFFEENEAICWVYYVELYSLKSNSWKEIRAFQPDHDHHLKPDPEGIYWFNNYVNGVYYWLTGTYGEHLILSFDMINEKFSTLPLPINPVEHIGGDLELLDFNGLLGAIFYPCPFIWLGTGEQPPLDLWVMNGGGSWTKQLSIEYVPGVVKPLGFWKNGEIFLDSLNNELVLFDPATKEVKNLGITNGISDSKYRMKLIAYVESLVPISGRFEQEEEIIRRWPAGEASNRH